MAKALLGYVGTAAPQQTREVAVLRRRVADLEAEVMRLKVENDGLHSTITENLSTADLLAPAVG